jgi:transposase
MITPSSNSSDIDGIRSLLVSLLEEGKDTEVVELVVSILHQLKNDNARLQLRLAKLLHERLGRRSEKISTAQLRLFLEEAVRDSQDEGADGPADAELPSPLPRLKKTSKRTGRRPLPADLPREEVVLEPPADQKVCPEHGAKVCIGYERSEVLEFVPASFKVIVHARPKYACRPCEGRVVIAPPASKPIESGLPGFGLLADVVVKKYADHAPLHRMRGIYRRHGVDLPVSTLAHWVAVAADALEPIARAIRRETLTAHVVQADDTGLRVLDPAKKGGSKRGHMWCYVGDRSWVTYDYTPTWEAEGPCTFLAARRGWIQADAYKGYDRLFKGSEATAVEVGCFAHARRYFFEALETDRRAAVAIHYIGQLYGVEHEATEKRLDPDGRLALRREKSKPILEALGKWVKETMPAAPPKSPLGQGLTYTVNQWAALGKFLEDGRLELDNNACERALRTIAVGRKNWLFAGSDEGAKRAAVIYTVFGTCRVNGIDPWAYMKDVLEKLAEGWLQSRVAELLPPNWAKPTAAAPPDEDVAIPA